MASPFLTESVDGILNFWYRLLNSMIYNTWKHFICLKTAKLS